MFGADFKPDQVKDAELFASEAKAQFNLSDEQAEQLLEARYEFFRSYGKAYKMTQSGKTEEAQAFKKTIPHALAEKFCEITGCKKNEYWKFQKAHKAKLGK